MRILYVDPDENGRRMVCSLLQLASLPGLTVAEEVEPDAVPGALRRSPADVILLAVATARPEGVRALEMALAARAAPVIVLAAEEEFRAALVALKLGAADFLVKSQLSAHALIRALREAVERWDPSLTLVRPAFLLLGAVGAGGGPEAGRAAAPAVEAAAGPAVAPPAAVAARPAAAPGSAPSVARPVTGPVAAVPQVRNYSTAGIDAAMARMGLHRPRLLSDVITEARQKAETILEDVCQKPHPVNYGLLVQVASSLREHVRDIRDGQAVLAYRYAEEDYFGGNAVNVATLAQLLAEAHGCDDETVVQAMVAGLLHDIGFVSMGSRDFDSPIAIGEHCGAGAQLARRIGAPSLVLKILQQHEEHADGSGLPARLPASEIAPEAQFVLAAVTYSNLFTGRVLQDPIRRQREYRGVPLRVDDPLTTILQDLKRWFRPDVLKVLILQYGFYSPGTLVQLNNKSVARVIGQNPGKPTTPVVEIVYRADGSRPEDMTLVDLSREAALAIAKVLSFEQIQ